MIRPASRRNCKQIDRVTVRYTARGAHAGQPREASQWRYKKSAAPSAGYGNILEHLRDRGGARQGDIRGGGRRVRGGQLSEQVILAQPARLHHFLLSERGAEELSVYKTLQL
jgi:hypothetical protein